MAFRTLRPFFELRVRRPSLVPRRARLVSLSLGLLMLSPGAVRAVVPAWSFDGGQPGAHLGFSVASAGDVNGDGYGDVIVGAPDADDGQTGEGIARLFLGSASGLSHAPSWAAGSDRSGARFGFSVASAGDVNGDGFADIVVGAPDYDGRGATFLFLGSVSGPAPSPGTVWLGSQTGERFGSAVASAGDVDGDGLGDVLVGAPGFDGGHEDEGAAFLFLGSAGTLPALPAWTTEGGQVGAELGTSVAGLGLLNDDAFADVAIGAPLFDGGQVDEGQVRVFAGSASGLGAVPLQTFEKDVAGARFGFSVAGGGNLAGDGRPRILFGAPIYHYTATEEGGTFLGAIGLTTFFLDFGRQAYAHRGTSIASAGDVNADGLLDVIIGADLYDNGEIDEGLVTVHVGHPSFVVDRTPYWTLEANQGSCGFGSSVASAGDVNGDGFGDVVAGAPRYDATHEDEGRAFVFLGPSGGPVSVGDPSATLARPTLELVGPNPFRTFLSLRYTVRREGRVRLSVLDVRGRQMALLVDESKATGTHVVTWDGHTRAGAECGPGVFFVRLEQGKDVAVGKALGIK